jgi:two-component system chemotaxis response regulator CheY
MKARRILVVDDSPSMRRVLVQALEEAGFEPVEAEDGIRAIELASEGIDLALVDFNLPGMDGVTVIRRLRAAEGTRFTPIVMVTTETRRERREEARAAGATGWIVKPFRPADVVQTIRRLLPRDAGEEEA